MEKIAIFIDGGYLTSLTKDHFNKAKIDFAKLSGKIAQGSNLLRTYYYNCKPYISQNPSQDEKRRQAGFDSFISSLERLDRFETKLGKLAYRGDNQNGDPIFVQKRVDVMFAVDLVQLAHTGKIHKAVILAGDSDFVPAVQTVKQIGVEVLLYHGPRITTHQELWDTCDERTEIDQNFINHVIRT